MIKHNKPKTFQDKMKNEETFLSKNRNPLKPEMEELSSLYDKIPTRLDPLAASFNLPLFIESYENLL